MNFIVLSFYLTQCLFNCLFANYKDMQLFGIISRTVVVCPAISAPDNGQLSLTNGFDFNSRASYSCDQGYNLVDGAFLRLCRANGAWSSVAPTCERKLLV